MRARQLRRVSKHTSSGKHRNTDCIPKHGGKEDPYSTPTRSSTDSRYQEHKEMTTAGVSRQRHRAEWKHAQSALSRIGSNIEHKCISSQSLMAEDHVSTMQVSQTSHRQASKPRKWITVAARHRPPQATFITQRTVASASVIQTRLTRSLEYNTTSPLGPRYPWKNSMLRVCSTHVIPTCAGCCTHAGFLHMSLNPTGSQVNTARHRP